MLRSPAAFFHFKTAGYAGYSAGGIGTEMSVVNMFRTSITKNTGSMSGGLMVFASNVTAVDCDISNVSPALKSMP